MSISIEMAAQIIEEFCQSYPAAANIAYRVKNTPEELYGKDHGLSNGSSILGGFCPGESALHQGRCDFAVANVRDESTFRAVLRHEVIGHYAINTFEPEQKRRLINTILKSRNEPGIAELWDEVKKTYPDQPERIQAEEVYCFACEQFDAASAANTPQARIALSRALDGSLKINGVDLGRLVSQIAHRLKDSTTVQQTFPDEDGKYFRREAVISNEKPLCTKAAARMIAKLNGSYHCSPSRKNKKLDF
jgi:putative DNA primase/helicase